MARIASEKPTKAALERAARLEKLKAKKALLREDALALDRKIKAVASIDDKVTRRQETQDKILIGIAALNAAATDPLVRSAIDAAIYDMDGRERDHLMRGQSLWSKLPPLPAAAVPGRETPAVPNYPRVEDALLDGDQDVSNQPQEARAPATTSTADPAMQVLPPADWRWYGRPDDANTDKPTEMGMSATNTLWLANTQSQVEYMKMAHWEHIPHYDGLRDMAEIEAWIDNSLEQERLESVHKAAQQAERLEEDEKQKEISRIASEYVKSRSKGSRKKQESDSH